MEVPSYFLQSSRGVIFLRDRPEVAEDEGPNWLTWPFWDFHHRIPICNMNFSVVVHATNGFVANRRGRIHKEQWETRFLIFEQRSWPDEISGWRPTGGVTHKFPVSLKTIIRLKLR